MKKLLLFFLFAASGFFFGQESINIDSVYIEYKPLLDKYADINPKIDELEQKRIANNETYGLIILENDPTQKRKLILNNFPKERRDKILKMSNSEIEKSRKEYDWAYKAKIILLCKKIELENAEYQFEELQKSKVNYLISNGYDLAEFNKLSTEKQKKILKNWKY